NALPADPDSFGLIHVDFHQGNFFVHEGKITLFDFDDCHYDYFANDIAIPLFYAARSAMSGSDTVKFARVFLSAFVTGYRKVCQLPVRGFDHLHDFMKLREILLYSIILSEEADKESEWCRRFLEDRRERIENGRLVIEIDFADFAR
ncbi:MAG TPA: phosphotransferase, partial [candidate division Zixibacteria bacterium]|nr:phosphotransferase [candidate division Zixibacteria bacterium]